MKHLKEMDEIDGLENLISDLTSIGYSYEYVLYTEVKIYFPATATLGYIQKELFPMFITFNSMRKLNATSFSKDLEIAKRLALVEIKKGNIKQDSHDLKEVRNLFQNKLYPEVDNIMSTKGKFFNDVEKYKTFDELMAAFIDALDGLRLEYKDLARITIDKSGEMANPSTYRIIVVRNI